MSPLEASNYWPEKSRISDELVTIPDVDCGDGYRQLRWLEEITGGDEYFGGRDGDRQWMPITFGIGSRYRPHTSTSIYSPWSIVRRKITK